MKTFYLIILIIFVLQIGVKTNAQNWLTTGNTGLSASNFLGNKDANALIFKTNNIERGRLLTNGKWQFGLNANNSLNIDSLGKLSFSGKGNYYVGDNRYIFHYASDTTKGLYLNSTINQYQFLNSTKQALFYVNGDNGNSGVLGTFKIGAYTLPKTDGTNGQVLQTNGSGAISWKTVSGGSGSGWSLTGNSGTTPGTNFIGTTDAKALIFKTKNIERMRIGGLGAVGIGTVTPKGALNVIGTSTATLTSAGYVVIGDSASYNLGIDNYQIQARGGNNASFLNINALGGVTYLGNAENSEYGSISRGYFSGAYGYGIQYGVYGFSVSGSGVYGISYYESGKGVYGFINGGFGDAVHGEAISNADYGGYFSSVSSYGLYASTQNSNSYAAYFAGNVNTSGIYLGSDKKLKENITDVAGAMYIINQLKPKKYNYRQDGNYKLMNLPQGLQYGLIAQDVEKVLPNLIKESEFDVDRATEHSDGKVLDPKDTTTVIAKQVVTKTGEVINYKALNYTELIPIMIKGMQEQQSVIDKQQAQINQQQQQIDELKQMVQSAGGNASSLKTNSSAAYLLQNSPNPFSQSTIIKYNLAATTERAQLVICSVDGKLMKTFSLSKTTNSIAINAGELSSGTYTYSLITNGQTVDTKTMVITK